MSDLPRILSIRAQYTKLLADKITVSVEDLSPSEVTLINESFEIFDSKLDEIKALSDEVKRLSIELANLKAMTDFGHRDTNEDDEDEFLDGH